MAGGEQPADILAGFRNADERGMKEKE